jgi:hypothetical protein
MLGHPLTVVADFETLIARAGLAKQGLAKTVARTRGKIERVSNLNRIHAAARCGM